VKVRYTRQALSDIFGIATYIRERNPSAAAHVENAIRSTIGLLAEFPKIGRERAELDVRSLGVSRYPYTVYYRIEGEEIWIVHVRDDRRKPLQPGKL
jgi:toxin ParE1/3/4